MQNVNIFVDKGIFMTSDYLNDLSIYALRELARRVGVNSPTSKKKDQLITEILAIENGVMQPQTIKSKQGRPPKGVGLDFASLFKNSLEQDSKYYIKLNQSADEYNSNQITVNGYLEKVNTTAYLWVQKDWELLCYFVPSSVLCGHNFKTGDQVSAIVSMQDNQLLATEILSANSLPVSMFNEDRLDYFTLKQKMRKQPIKYIKNSPQNFLINYGENVYFYGNNGLNNTMQLAKFLTNVNVDEKIFIALSIPEKNKPYIDQITDMHMFLTQITDTKDKTKKIVDLAIESAKRFVENGKSVAVAIDDVKTLQEFDDQDFTLTKTMLNLTKNAENGGSITTFAIIPSTEIAWVEKLADHKIKVEDDTLTKI